MLKSRHLLSLAAALLVFGCSEPPREKVKEFGDTYNRGIEFYGKGDFVQAEPLLKSALDKGIQLYGPDDRSLTGIRDNSDPSASVMYPTSLYAELATTYEKLGKFDLAEPLRRKDLQLHEKYLGPWGEGGDIGQHGIDTEIRTLANNLVQQNKLDEAEKLYKRSIEIREQHISEEGKRYVKGDLWPEEHAALAEIRRRRGK